MVDYPQFLYSKKDVGRAGKKLAGDLIWTTETQDEIRHAFAVANSWRDSHAAPMRRIHAELIAKIRKLGLKQTAGISAARLKRMTSIRKKLRRISIGLDSIQDLGGCRAILPRIEDVQRLVNVYGDSCRHIVFDEDNYIAKPKPGESQDHGASSMRPWRSHWPFQTMKHLDRAMVSLQIEEGVMPFSSVADPEDVARLSLVLESAWCEIERHAHIDPLSRDGERERLGYIIVAFWKSDPDGELVERSVDQFLKTAVAVPPPAEAEEAGRDTSEGHPS